MEYNYSDIQDLVFNTRRRRPELAKFAQFLDQWVSIVSCNSDGWSHWSGGSRAAAKLVKALADPNSTLAQATKALAPIRSCATRHKLPCPTLPE